MKMFWRDEPLNQGEIHLLELVLAAHHKSVFRNNTSSVVVLEVARSSADYTKAIAVGILALGGAHAPLEKTHNFLSLENPAREVAGILKHGDKVPGWGGTFQKNEPDPIWSEVSTYLAIGYPYLARKLDQVTRELAERGKELRPNPSAYTAAAAIVLGLPAKQSPYLLIAGRLTGWSELSGKYLTNIIT